MAGRRLIQRRALPAIAALAIVPTAVSAAQPAPPAPIALARLQGTFDLAGRVTVAQSVRGERAGQAVSRLWTFASPCPSGQCEAINLVRGRAHAADALVLSRRGPGLYAGIGSFFSALRCAGRVYPQGQEVPFTITVGVTTATQVGTVVVATRIIATYQNRIRINLTPCVGALGHDAARYHGHLASTA
jgi:phosphate/sulfate permease